MAKIKVGNIIRATVTGIESYGAFVTCDDYYSGLIHISEISHGYVKSINDYLKIGDIIFAEILEIDEQLGQLKLSIKNINYRQKKYYRKKRLKETKLGFNTLDYFLPIWIEEGLKRIEKTSKN